VEKTSLEAAKADAETKVKELDKQVMRKGIALVLRR
jgi:hypothetical protein